MTITITQYSPSYSLRTYRNVKKFAHYYDDNAICFVVYVEGKLVYTYQKNDDVTVSATAD